VSVKSCHI